MKKNIKREILRARRKQELRKKRINWAVGVVLVVSLGVLIVRNETKPAVGLAVPVERSDHVQEGTELDIPSDPPTSGSHYRRSMPAGFYQENSPEMVSMPNPEGYIIHSLEHGYIVFWYNCQLLDEGNCASLKEDIQSVMDALEGYKLIAFPRSSIEAPLVMTSWGQLQEFQAFDEELAMEFIRTNRVRAPEPGAP